MCHLMLYNMCHVMLYNMYHVMLYNIKYVMLYNMCHVMLYNIKYVMPYNMRYVMLYNICHVMLYKICHVMLYNMCPANSPGFPGSLQVFYQISQSPGQSTKSSGLLSISVLQLEIQSIFSQNSNLFYSLYSFWDIFAHVYLMTKISSSLQ